MLRPFTDPDYPAVARVWSAVFRDHPVTADELRRRDRGRQPGYHFRRLVAEQDGAVVGAGESFQPFWMYHPRKYFLDIAVQPEHQGRGFGAALYQELWRGLEPLEPLLLRTHTRSDWGRSLRFLADRGFAEEMRFRESRLDLASAPPPPAPDDVERGLRARGISVHAFSEIDDPLRDRTLYELHKAIEDDIPSPEPPSHPSFEVWFAERRSSPGFLPDANFVAVQGGEWVGLSSLRRRAASTDLEVGVTGVRRSARRQGIALALKLRTIDYARRAGATGILTGNEVNNVGMLALNERLGFVPIGLWVNFVKRLDA
jgi:GNAT superfamily N-acetyltransferase